MVNEQWQQELLEKLEIREIDGMCFKLTEVSLQGVLTWIMYTRLQEVSYKRQQVD